MSDWEKERVIIAELKTDVKYIREDINKLYNTHWVRPKLSEIPSKYVGLDDGTYW